MFDFGNDQMNKRKRKIPRIPCLIKLLSMMLCPTVHWAMGCRQNALSDATSSFLGSYPDYLSWVACLSTNNKVDKMILEAVHISNITPKTSARKLMKVVWPAFTSNGMFYLHITSVGSHSMSGRKKRRKGWRRIKVGLFHDALSPIHNMAT